MPRYVAFLRGVSPMNLKMSDLARCLDSAGFQNVKTVLSSGNAVFDTSLRSSAEIERRIETALKKEVGRTFFTIVRSVKELQDLLATDPYADFNVPAQAKRVVTFGRRLAKPKQTLPLARDGAQVLSTNDREGFTAYVAGASGPVFMELIKAAFGDEVTTRTWETLKKCAKA